MKRVSVVLTVALLVLFLAVPVGAQEHGPVITGLQSVPTPGAACDTECLDLMTDGSPVTGCECWDISWCTTDHTRVNFGEALVWVTWPEGFYVNVSDWGVPLPSRTVEPVGIYDGGAATYRFVNLGEGNCIVFHGISVSAWGSPTIYEVEFFEPPASGHHAPFGMEFWQVRQQIGKVISAPIVSNFIYVILALIFGGMGLTMIIRGLFGSTGVGDFHHGSGMTHRGSGLTHPREVGDVD